MVQGLSSRGFSFSAVTVSAQSDIPASLAGVPVTALAPTPPALRRLRPLLEVPRIATALAKRLQEPHDLVLAYGPYSLLAASLALRRRPHTLVYYSDELYDGVRFIPQQVSEQLARSAVSALVSCQQDREQLTLARMRMRVPSLVVPNACDDYFPTHHGAPAEQSNDARTVFIYQGGLHLNARALPELIRVIGKASSPPRVLRLAVRARRQSDLRLLQSLIDATPHPDNFELLPFVAYPTHFRATAQAHVGVMLYKDVSLNYRYCAPNKLYEYPMMGLPVLSSRQPHLAKEIEGHGFGLCVDPADESALLNAVERLCDKTLREPMAQRARSWYLDNGQYSLHAQRLAEFLRLLSAPHATAAEKGLT